MSLETVGTALGLILTLMVFSYLIDDTPVYRLAASLLVGLSLGYFMALMLWNVLIPHWRESLGAPDPARWPWLLAELILGLLVLARGLPRLGWLGDLGLAAALGIGLGTAGVGALLGTVVPQVQAGAGQGISLALAATLLALLAAQFYAPPARIRFLASAVKGLQALGRGIWAFALGALFGGALITAVSLLIGRAEFLIQAFNRLGW